MALNEIRIIDGLFLNVVLAWSFIVIVLESVRFYKSQRSGYAPLINKANTLPTSNTYYGATSDADNDNASDDTVVMEVEIMASRWTVFNLSRFLISAVQLGLFVYVIGEIIGHRYELSKSEGKIFDILISYGTRATFWVSKAIVCRTNLDVIINIKYF